jgi:hypothetical protein
MELRSKYTLFRSDRTQMIACINYDYLINRRMEKEIDPSNIYFRKVCFHITDNLDGQSQRALGRHTPLHSHRYSRTHAYTPMTIVRQIQKIFLYLDSYN